GTPSGNGSDEVARWGVGLVGVMVGLGGVGVGVAISPPEALNALPVVLAVCVGVGVTVVVVAGPLAVGLAAPARPLGGCGEGAKAATRSVASVCESSRPVAGRLLAAWKARSEARTGAESVPSMGPW